MLLLLLLFFIYLLIYLFAFLIKYVKPVAFSMYDFCDFDIGYSNIHVRVSTKRNLSLVGQPHSHPTEWPSCQQQSSM